ncbi:D-lactate dehydrogenase SCDLUD_000213 [Saccharomycodes ludwigii]|uniref:D-lactate dehydrogenase n=1 Tax=Saccharomycodes ludwigii TaxID=36035 RepID=UPI001E87628C|nr:hypothetical protein SCDLUD_000213 [Saccharomycodes ludwigii]KAH3902632.1 hypothetical protein SCDLUD_000213 [Saccharomycodes ludwigii]
MLRSILKNTTNKRISFLSKQRKNIHFQNASPTALLLKNRIVGNCNYSTSSKASPNNSNILTSLIPGVLIGTGLSLGTCYFLGLFDDDDDANYQSVMPLDELSPPKYCDDPNEETEVIARLKAVLGENPDNFSISPEEIDSHSDTYFTSHHATKEQRPQIILYPHNTEQVSQILQICNNYSVPVVPFSGGTSLEGHFVSTRGKRTVVLDFSRYMNNILELHQKDLDVVVEAGVPWEDLNSYLNDHGLLFGCDPGPGAEIGGCIANSCSGTNANRYGTMKENVVNLTVVLADGSIIKTRQRPRKSSAGYNLTGLFIGSEGTLGVVTEATIKCHVMPKHETVAVIPFPSIALAADCVSTIVGEGLQLNAMELLDDKMMKVINQTGSTSRTWLEQPTLFFKVGGQDDDDIKKQVSMLEKIASANKAIKFEFAKNDDEKLELWEARKVALWSTLDAGKKLNPKVNLWTTDVAVPISKFASVIDETKKEMESSGLISTIVGHAGDGNFHAFICYDETQKPIAEKLVDNMVKRAIDNEGTCTGEHGIGLGKRQYLLEELGDAPVNLMRQIKLSLDPQRILNPDKIFKIDPNDHEH